MEDLHHLTLEVHRLDVLYWYRDRRNKVIKLIDILQIGIFQHLKWLVTGDSKLLFSQSTGCPGTAGVGSNTSLSTVFVFTFFSPKDSSNASISNSDWSVSSAGTGCRTFTLNGRIFIFSFFLAPWLSLGLKLLCYQIRFIIYQLKQENKYSHIKPMLTF